VPSLATIRTVNNHEYVRQSSAEICLEISAPPAPHVANFSYDEYTDRTVQCQWEDELERKGYPTPCTMAKKMKLIAPHTHD